MDLQQIPADAFMLLTLQTLNKIMVLPYMSNDLFHSHAYIWVCIYIYSIHVRSIKVYSVSVILPLSCSSPSSHRRTLWWVKRLWDGSQVLALGVNSWPLRLISNTNQLVQRQTFFLPCCIEKSSLPPGQNYFSIYKWQLGPVECA